MNGAVANGWSGVEFASCLRSQGAGVVAATSGATVHAARCSTAEGSSLRGVSN
jgi:hypothetical protein